MKIEGAKKWTPQKNNGNSINEMRAVVVEEVDLDEKCLKGYVVSAKDGTVLADNVPKIPVKVTLSDAATERAKESNNSKEGDFPYGGIIDSRVRNWLLYRHKGSKATKFPKNLREKYLGKRIAVLQNPMMKGKFATATQENPVEITADWINYIEAATPNKLFFNTPVTVHPARVGFSTIAVYDVNGEGNGIVKAVEATPANIKKMAAFFDDKKKEAEQELERYNQFLLSQKESVIKSPRPYAGFSLRVVRKEHVVHDRYRKDGTMYSFSTNYTLLANSPFYEYSKNERTEDNQYLTELVDGEFFKEKVNAFIQAAKEAFGDDDDVKVEIVPALLFTGKLSKKNKGESNQNPEKSGENKENDESLIQDKMLLYFLNEQKGTYIQYQDEESQERDNVHTLSKTAAFVSMQPSSCEEGDDGEIIFDDTRLRVIQFKFNYNFPQPIHSSVLSSEFDGDFAKQRNFILHVPEERIHNIAGNSERAQEYTPPPPVQNEQQQPTAAPVQDIDDDIPF